MLAEFRTRAHNLYPDQVNIDFTQKVHVEGTCFQQLKFIRDNKYGVERHQPLPGTLSIYDIVN